MAYFDLNSHNYIRLTIQELVISYNDVQQILKKYRKHDFSFMKVNLHSGDNIRQIQFCRQMVIRIQEHSRFSARLFKI